MTGMTYDRLLYLSIYFLSFVMSSPTRRAIHIYFSLTHFRAYLSFTSYTCHIQKKVLRPPTEDLVMLIYLEVKSYHYTHYHFE